MLDLTIFRKRLQLSALILLLLLCLTGCQTVTGTFDSVTGTAGSQKAEGTYTIYYKNAAADTLTERSYQPDAETFEEILTQLLTQLSLSPAEEMQSVLGSETQFSNWTRGVDNVTVDLSSGYLALSSTDQVLLKAAVVKTLVQIPGLASVYLTVEGQEITNEAGESVGPMNEETFIETHGEGINSLQTVALTLYFSSLDGSSLIEESREVSYSSNLTVEEIVLKELIEGSDSTEVLPVLGTDTGINSVSVEDTVCRIDFDSRVNEYTGKAGAETALYAIVNSICENSSSAASVQISINGSTEERFREQISLDQTFLPRTQPGGSNEGAETEGA